MLPRFRCLPRIGAVAEHIYLPRPRLARVAHRPVSFISASQLDCSQRKKRGAQTNDEASGEQHEVVGWSAEDPMWVAIGLPRILVVVLGEKGLIGPGVVEGYKRGRLR